LKAQSNSKLPGFYDPIKSDFSLIEGGISHRLNGFSISSICSTQPQVLKISLDSETSHSFYDFRDDEETLDLVLRKTFEVRIGELGFQEGQIWKKDEPRQWRVKIEVEGVQPDLLRVDHGVYSTAMDKEQKKFLRENGYVRLSNLIPQVDVEKALKLVNIAMLEEGIKTSRAFNHKREKYVGLAANQSYSGKFRSAFEIAGLVNFTKVTGVLADLIGFDTKSTNQGCQIALLFPDDIPQPIPVEDLGFHIDGEPNHNDDPTFNGVPQLSIYNALVGIYLKDIKAENHGNFVVYPGSHNAHAEHIRKYGAGSFINELGRLKMPLSKPELQKPVQICVNAGDVVIANYLTAHAIACHIGPEVRYALYFRISLTDLEKHRQETLKDPWHCWKGLAAEKLI